MKPNVMLTISSLLTLLFVSLHHADDVVRGFVAGKFTNLIPIVVFVIWLYGSKLVLDERKSGYILILVLCFLVSGIPVIHMTGAGISGGRIAHSHGAFFFVWTLLVIGATSLFSVLLAATELWSMRRKRQ